MSSNQPVSKVSSHQLNELVRLVVRMFINEVNSLEENRNNRNVPQGSIKLQGGISKEDAMNLAKLHWYVFRISADANGVWQVTTRGKQNQELPCCKIGKHKDLPAILNNNGDGTEHLLVGDEIMKDLDKDMINPSTDKQPMMDEMSCAAAAGPVSTPMAFSKRKVKEAASGNTDPTREEMIEYLQVVYSGLLDRSSFDDAAEVAMYWFANFNHGGQSSNLYSVLSTSPYSPGRMENEPRPETVERDMFDALTREFGSGEQVNEGEEADAVHDMHSDHEASHYEKHYSAASKKTVNTQKSNKTPRKSGKALVKGKVITLKESNEPDYPFTDAQKKTLVQYFEKNQDVNFDAMAATLSQNLGQPVSSKQLYSIYVDSLMGGGTSINEQKEEDQIEEMTTTGDVSGYNVPSAFARKGGSKKGVEGSAALGYTLTSIGQKEMERTGDKLLENKQ